MVAFFALWDGVDSLDVGCSLWKILATRGLETNIFQKQPLEVSYNFNIKRLWHRFFPVNFAKFLRSPFFREHPWMTGCISFEADLSMKTLQCFKRNDAEQANILWE